MNLDLIFLIDGSDSITVSQFEKIKDWIAKMIETLNPIELNTETLSIVVQFSDDVKVEVTETFSDPSIFIQKVSKMSQLAMGTNTATALSYLNRNIVPR